MKPKLFILQMPFKDADGNLWFCSHCALIEGALLINSHWIDRIDIKRIPSKKPRQELVDILGENEQWMPVLILSDRETIRDPIKITQYLAKTYGGAFPHP